jgi:uncharacterized protein YeaO (DUF488 family)
MRENGPRLVLKRVSEKPAPEDGFRVLIGRPWPRGVLKNKAAVDAWLKDLAPSYQLRKWFNNDLRKWPAFKDRYHRELGRKMGLIRVVENCLREGKVTLVYGAADPEYNYAAALRDYLLNRTRLWEMVRFTESRLAA